MANLYDKSSLVMIPSGKKDGTVFSQKPVDGSGDFTFSRGSNLAATRVGPTGLIEKGRENLLTQSNSFDLWNVNNVTSGHAGYDGTNDAWLQSGTSRLQRNVSLGTSVYTGSVYVKAGFSEYVQLYIVGSSIALTRFELIGNGTIVFGGGISPKIEPVSGAPGWYRISTNLNSDTTTFRIYPINDSSGTQTADSSVYVQDAQLEIGLAATDYIESGATTGKAGLSEDEPRFDYSGGATCPSLLLEPQRVNLIGYSEYYGSNLFVNSSPEINNTTSPEGVQNATLLKEDTNSGNHAIREPSNTNIATDDSQYVISFYAKSNGRNIRFIDDGYAGSGSIVNFNLSSGGTFNNGAAVIDADAVAIGTDGWYRCYAVIDKSGAAQSGFRFSLRLLGGASNDNDSYTGDGTSGVWIYGKEVNDSVSYPTSYIPNHSGGTITRGADQPLGLTTAGADGLINNYTTTIYIELDKIINTGLTRFVTLFSTGGGSNPRVLIYSSGVNFIIQYRVTGQADQYITKFSFDANTTNKLLVKINGTDLSMFHNGTKVGNITIVQGDDLAYLSLAESAATDAGYFLGKLLSFPEALSDADCIAITTL